jgi:cell division protease FtsH
MSELFPWLPIGTLLENGLSIGRLLQSGENFQTVLSGSGERAILFLKDNLYQDDHGNIISPALSSLLERNILRKYSFSDDDFLIADFPRLDMPKKVASLVGSAGNATSIPLRELSFALADLRSLEPKAVWSEAIYLPSEKICIAPSIAHSGEPEHSRYTLAVSLLVGAMPELSLDIETIRKLNPDLETSDIREFLAVLGFGDSLLLSRFGKNKIQNPDTFILPGRPELQAFFREYIIDFFFRFEEYRSMGFSPPNGILLYGPPGSGKTFAVNKLAEFLKWTVFDVDIGGIGSPFIHETSKKLKQVFQTASEQAPSIVLLEEIDALAGRRNDNAHDSKIEEVSQLLRLLEKAASNAILVIATTNRYEVLDSAIVRRGRFDHVIEVGFPSEIEISLALESLLKLRPSNSLIDVKSIASSLVGRPMSDVSWVVNEAARFAVRYSKNEIDDEMLVQATRSLSKSTSRV